MSLKDCLDLFQAVPKEGNKYEIRALTFVPEYGALITPEASHYTREIMVWLGEAKVSGKALNQSFYKSWNKVKDTSLQERIADQVVHYFTTYGLKGIGLYRDNLVYIPAADLDVPETLQILVIKGVDNDTLVARALDMLSGTALDQKTIDKVLGTLEVCGYTFDGTESIKNAEARTIIYDKIGIEPKDPEDLFRYLYYKATGGKSLVIKNEDTYSLIGDTKYQLPFLEYPQKAGLSRSFNRRKEIWLAIKKAHPANRNTVNSISKLSKSYHKPMPKDVLGSLTSDMSTSEDELLEACKHTNLSRIVRAYNGVAAYRNTRTARFYQIRNGKGYAKTVTKRKDDSIRLSVIMDILRKVILSRLEPKLKGTKVYLPEHVDYAYPVSEKQFVGNIPSGTSIYLPKSEDHTLIGIYWKGSSVDLDLSGVSSSDKVGWDGLWNHESKLDTSELMYSGDVTSAPNGATEFLYAKSVKEPYFIKVNAYSVPNDNYPYKVILGYGSGIKKNYIIDPNKVVFQADLTFPQREVLLGILENTDKGMRFHLTNQGSGSGAVSAFDSTFDSTIREWLEAKVSSQLRLRSVLASLGCLVDSPANADVDLNPSVLSKDTLMSLLSA